MKITAQYQFVDRPPVRLRSVESIASMELVLARPESGPPITAMKQRVKCHVPSSGKEAGVVATLLELENSTRMKVWRQTDGDNDAKAQAAAEASRQLMRLIGL